MELSLRSLVSLRGAVFNGKISLVFVNPFSQEIASEKTSHFYHALPPYENERELRTRDSHRQTERKEEENTFRRQTVLRFTWLKEISRSRAHQHPKGTINSGAAIARESKKS